MSSIDFCCQNFRSLRLINLSNHLPVLLKEAAENDWSPLKLASMMAEYEVSERSLKRVLQNYRKAEIPVRKDLKSFDYRYQTSITKRQVNQLLDFTFLENRENLVFIGPPGVGKTHLAIGIGREAIEKGYKVCFKTALDLIETLELAEIKGCLKKKINQILKFDLLIVDELGYLPMSKQGMYNLFQLINAMYEYRSLIITTNKDFTNWSDFFLEDNVAVPTVDRIIHHSHIFMLGGESYRLKSKVRP